MNTPKTVESLLSIEVLYPENAELKSLIDGELVRVMKTAGERAKMKGDKKDGSMILESDESSNKKEFYRHSWWLLKDAGFVFSSPQVEFYHSFLDYLDNGTRYFQLTYSPKK